MPLSPSAPRQKIHRRKVICEGFKREDGLWDIEGRLEDTKTYDFPNYDRGGIKAGEPLHGMHVRITIDDQYLIHDAEAVTDFGPSNSCADIPRSFKQLVGMRIGPGWRRKTQELLGGAHGCTHLVDLLVPIATTAFQTIFPWKSHIQRRTDGTWPQEERPAILNSCHVLLSDTEIVKRRWPKYYTGE